MRNSWGIDGTAGDPINIKSAVDKILSGCNDLIEWEAEVKTLCPPEIMLQFRDNIRGSTKIIFEKIEHILNQLKIILADPGLKGKFALEIEETESVKEIIEKTGRYKKKS